MDHDRKDKTTDTEPASGRPADDEPVITPPPGPEPVHTQAPEPVGTPVEPQVTDGRTAGTRQPPVSDPATPRQSSYQTPVPESGSGRTMLIAAIAAVVLVVLILLFTGLLA